MPCGKPAVHSWTYSPIQCPLLKVLPNALYKGLQSVNCGYHQTVPQVLTLVCTIILGTNYFCTLLLLCRTDEAESNWFESFVIGRAPWLCSKSILDIKAACMYCPHLIMQGKLNPKLNVGANCSQGCVAFVAFCSILRAMDMHTDKF